VAEIDMNRVNRNLSSALRLFVFDHYCGAADATCAPPQAMRRSI
jgi:hypothetical protein